MGHAKGSISRKIIAGTVIPITGIFLITLFVINVLLNAQMDRLLNNELVTLIKHKVDSSEHEVDGILSLLSEQMQKNHEALLESFNKRLENLASSLAASALPLVEVFDYDAVRELVQQNITQYPHIGLMRVFLEKNSDEKIEMGNPPENPVVIAHEAASDNGYIKVELLASSQALKESFASEAQRLAAIKTNMQAINASFFSDIVSHNTSLKQGLINRMHSRLAPLFAIAVLIVAIWLFTFLRRLLIRPIRELCRVVSALADGELTQTAAGKFKGELATLRDAVHMCIGNLRGMVSDIRASASSIATASSQIAAGNLDLSQRTQEQVSTLVQTASSLNEMTTTVQHNADNARQANQLAASARDQAMQGGEVVSQAVNAMSGINTSSKRIADIIGVIDSIAFQTNLLALNAAVEAARAGEQGRGFAVVAAEVRKLAQRSAEAAKEIKTLIRDSVEKITDGSRLVDASGQTLTAIVQSVKKVSDIVSEITAASQEQAMGVEQVNQAVAQMDEATQQNAALVEEAASASESMNDQARTLNDLMAFFKVEAQATTADQEAGSPGPVPAGVAPVAGNRLLPAVLPPRTPGNGSHPVAAGHGDESDRDWQKF